ncbi:hypothetical protein [Anaeromicrobium sediminis]|uniref:Uncharacterized protein n=1 Tax=Anaeromicrobium sediminis TaxID=1478221 RepID=A0A267MQJ7_9FIRM|nr:hypothetical protein [Anaeromicrobium sediminis]PAB61000.1 hypothetical protein CCE28_00790 [Anaeromicrobium sediminis]
MTNEQITLIGIGVTFLIGVLNFIYSIGNNQKTRFINTVTNSRVKWIGELRKNISDYISLIPQNETGFIKLFERKDEFIESFKKSHMIIELMLNNKDEFGNTLLTDLTEINNKVFEIIKCIDLMNFNKLEEYKTLGLYACRDAQRRLIKELKSETQTTLKTEIIRIIGSGDNDQYLNMEACELIINDGIGRKQDACLICINKFSKEIETDVANLIRNCEKLLKKEWDRVKVESQIGKYDTDNEEWSVYIGFSKLNKAFKLIFSIMLIVIILLIVIA